MSIKLICGCCLGEKYLIKDDEVISCNECFTRGYKMIGEDLERAIE